MTTFQEFMFLTELGIAFEMYALCVVLLLLSFLQGR